MSLVSLVHFMIDPFERPADISLQVSFDPGNRFGLWVGFVFVIRKSARAFVVIVFLK